MAFGKQEVQRSSNHNKQNFLLEQNSIGGHHIIQVRLTAYYYEASIYVNSSKLPFNVVLVPKRYWCITYHNFHRL